MHVPYVITHRSYSFVQLHLLALLVLVCLVYKIYVIFPLLFSIEIIELLREQVSLRVCFVVVVHGLFALLYKGVL
jgi:hypothetical protein